MGSNQCNVCGWWDRICHCKDLDLFNTPKDKLYEFIDYKNFRQPIEVHGKRHWNSLLKQHGLIDDVKGIKDPEQKLVGREFIKDQMLSELHDKGLYHKLIKRRR